METVGSDPQPEKATRRLENLRAKSGEEREGRGQGDPLDPSSGGILLTETELRYGLLAEAIGVSLVDSLAKGPTVSQADPPRRSPFF